MVSFTSEGGKSIQLSLHFTISSISKEPYAFYLNSCKKYNVSTNEYVAQKFSAGKVCTIQIQFKDEFGNLVQSLDDYPEFRSMIEELPEPELSAIPQDPANQIEIKNLTMSKSTTPGAYRVLKGAMKWNVKC